MEFGARRILENKYDTKLEINPNAKYGFDKWFGNVLLSTQCKILSNGTGLLITLKTKAYTYKYVDYLESLFNPSSLKQR